MKQCILINTLKLKAKFTMLKYIQVFNIKKPKDNECRACLYVTLLDFPFVNPNKEYYPQIFLEECKYEYN